MNKVVGVGVVSHVHQDCLDWVDGHSHDTNHDYVTFAWLVCLGSLYLKSKMGSKI